MAARKTRSGYTPRATIFSSRNETSNSVYIHDAQTVARKLGKAGYGINNGGSPSGLMGVVAQAAKRAGGHVYGIALANPSRMRSSMSMKRMSITTTASVDSSSSEMPTSRFLERWGPSTKSSRSIS